MKRRPPKSPLFPYPPLFRSLLRRRPPLSRSRQGVPAQADDRRHTKASASSSPRAASTCRSVGSPASSSRYVTRSARSEEHTSELQSRQYLVCRLLLEKKKKL